MPHFRVSARYDARVDYQVWVFAESKSEALARAIQEPRESLWQRVGMVELDRLSLVAVEYENDEINPLGECNDLAA